MYLNRQLLQITIFGVALFKSLAFAGISAYYSEVDLSRLTAEELDNVSDEAIAKTTEEQAHSVGTYDLRATYEWRELDVKMLLLTTEQYKVKNNCVAFKNRIHLLQENVQAIIAKKCTPFIKLEELREKHYDNMIIVFKEAIKKQEMLKDTYFNSPVHQALRTEKGKKRHYFIQSTENVVVPFIQEFLKIKTDELEKNMRHELIFEMLQILASWRRDIALQSNDLEIYKNCRFMVYNGSHLLEPTQQIPAWHNFLMEKYLPNSSNLYHMEANRVVERLYECPYACKNTEHETFLSNYKTEANRNSAFLLDFLSPTQPCIIGQHSTPSLESFLNILEKIDMASNAMNSTDKYEKSLEFYHYFNQRSVLYRGQATISGWILLGLLRSIGKTFDLYQPVEAVTINYYTDKMQFNLYSLSARNMDEFHEYIKEYNLIRDYQLSIYKESSLSEYYAKSDLLHVEAEALSKVSDENIAKTSEEQAAQVGAFDLRSCYKRCYMDFKMLLLTLDQYKVKNNCVAFKNRIHLLKGNAKDIIAKKCMPFIKLEALRQKYFEKLSDILFGIQPNLRTDVERNRANFIRVTEEVAVPFIRESLQIKMDQLEISMRHELIYEMLQILASWRRDLAFKSNDDGIAYQCRFCVHQEFLVENIFATPVWNNFLMEKYLPNSNYLLDTDKKILKCPFTCAPKESDLFNSNYAEINSDFTIHFVSRTSPCISGYHYAGDLKKFFEVLDKILIAANATGSEDKYEKALEFYHFFNEQSVLYRGQATISGWILLVLLRNIGKTFDLYQPVNAPATIFYSDKMQFNLYSLSARNMEEFHEYIKKYDLIHEYKETQSIRY